jgi:hypothetical protein
MPATVNTRNETFEALWAYCTEDKRAIPRDWNKLYQKLKNKNQKPSGGWEPPLPLILAAWDATMPIEKQLRFKSHLEWARDQGQLAEIGQYLRSLNDSDWYHFGEL